MIFIYIVLASQFGSFLQPLAIMASLPLALIGVMLALLITRSTLNLFSMIGLVMLMGLVTKNAILLVDFCQARLEAAARAARAHEFIAALPEGYDTWIGERGVKLSVGQKQRVSIARVLLKDPPIVIFDEATSNIDTETEVKIREALNELTTGRTTFIIAHRLSTLHDVDRIVVLDNGRLVEDGRHDELVSRGGVYAGLYEAQFQV